MKALFSTSFFIIGLMYAPAAVQGAEKASEGANGAILLEINGEKITRADFERKYTGKMFQARNTYYDAERKVIDEFIEEAILEQAAKKEGLTVDQFMDKHVKSKVGVPPSEEGLKAYYEGLDTPETFEQIKGKIADSILQRRATKMKTALMAKLKSEANIVLRLAPPRAIVSLKDTPVRGPKNAAVTVIEYADYECPYCLQIQPALSKLEAEYKGKIALAYKDVPLPMHANAQKAAEATHCAGDQGKYWELHDLLLTTKTMDVASLKGYARTLKLDGAAFDKCLDSDVKAAMVKATLNEAQSMGLQGTPSFFINGRFISGAATYEKLKELVDEELSNLAAQNK